MNDFQAIRLSLFTLVLTFFISFSSFATAAAQNVKALVGGTLIDGYGSDPIQNSVIIIEGEHIKTIGQVGEVQIPDNAERISTEGMSVLPGLWDMYVHLMINGHTDYAHWDTTYADMLNSVIMPSSAHQLLLSGLPAPATWERL